MEFLALDLLPEDVRALRNHQIRSDQLCTFPQCKRLLRSSLFDHPFDGDAGIDAQRAHRTSRPSRNKSSEGVCFLLLVSLRNSAANFSTSGLASSASSWRW